MMRVILEHTVKVCSALEPMFAEVTLERLWVNLIEQLHYPAQYLKGLEGVEIEELSTGKFLRTKNYGKFSVCELIDCSVVNQVRISIRKTKQWPASCLTIRLQQSKTKGSWYLRFTYEEDSVAEVDSQAQMLAKFREKAYVAKDLDFVECLRQKLQVQ